MIKEFLENLKSDNRLTNEVLDYYINHDYENIDNLLTDMKI